MKALFKSRARPDGIMVKASEESNGRSEGKVGGRNKEEGTQNADDKKRRMRLRNTSRPTLMTNIMDRLGHFPLKKMISDRRMI